MKLGTKSKYAIIALVDIASNESDQPVSLSAIAEKQNLPLPYLEQIFLKLRRNDIVKSIRGSNGGYALSRDTSEICILDIIESMESIQPSTRCSVSSSNFPCVKHGSHCLTHRLWRNLDSLVLTFLKNISLKDVCDQKIDTLLFKINREEKQFLSDHMLEHFSLRHLEYSGVKS